MTFRGQRYASSYEILASVVPSTSQSIEVLDLACGDGFLLALLASRAQPHLSLSGVDLSAGELAVAAQRLGHSIPLIQARAQE
ncbi:MAG: methyltransferase domain-containing protein, partial [Lacisediminimonas sp.]|nr:methyltransferase domain-containing protein [Lacisediminimonas sp.]